MQVDEGPDHVTRDANDVSAKPVYQPGLEGPPQTVPESRWLHVMLGALVAGKLALLAWNATHLRWVMDEFANAYMARFVGDGIYHRFPLTKTVLPFPAFYLAHLVNDAAPAILAFMRCEMLVVAVATVVTVGMVCRRAFGGLTAPLFAMFLVLCFTNWMETSTNVRGDPFAVLAATGALLALVSPRQSRRDVVLAGVLVGVAFLCTQKSIYHVAAIGVGLVGGAAAVPAGAPSRLTTALRCSALYGAGVAAAILVYSVLFGGADFGRVLDAMFLAPWRMREQVLSGASYVGLEQFVHETLSANLGPYLLCGAGLITAFVEAVRANKPRVVAAALATVVVTLAVFLHPQPWPYVFTMCIPYLAVFGPRSLRLVPAARRAAVTAILAAGLAVTFARNATSLQYDDSNQLEVVREVEGLLGKDERYFDGVGMIPTRTIAGRDTWWWWDVPTFLTVQQRFAAGDDGPVRGILEDQPKVWIFNYRLQRAPFLNPVFEESVVRIAPVVLVSGQTVDPGEPALFRNYWAGTYRLVDGDGKDAGAPIVDDNACSAPCFIPVGSHWVSSSATGVSFLLPADVHPRLRLPVTEPAIDLYANVYSF